MPFTGSASVAGFAKYNVLSVGYYSIFIEQDASLVQQVYATRKVKRNVDTHWNCEKV